MSQWDTWLDQFASHPIVQLLGFVLLYVIRIEVDRRLRKRETRRKKPKESTASG